MSLEYLNGAVKFWGGVYDKVEICEFQTNVYRDVNGSLSCDTCFENERWGLTGNKRLSFKKMTEPNNNTTYTHVKIKMLLPKVPTTYENIDSSTDSKMIGSLATYYTNSICENLSNVSVQDDIIILHCGEHNIEIPYESTNKNIDDTAIKLVKIFMSGLSIDMNGYTLCVKEDFDKLERWKGGDIGAKQTVYAINISIETNKDLDWSQENKNVVEPPKIFNRLCQELLKKKAESINKEMCNNYKKNVASNAIVSETPVVDTENVDSGANDDETSEVDKTETVGVHTSANDDETSEVDKTETVDVHTSEHDDETSEVDKTETVVVDTSEHDDETHYIGTPENGVEETKEEDVTTGSVMNTDYNDSDDESMTSDDIEYHQYLEKQEKYYQNLTSEQKKSYDTLDEHQKSLTMEVHLDSDTWKHIKTLM